MILGFTGTRHGMTLAQQQTVRRLIHGSALALAVGGGGLTEVHHGDCIGADCQFHHIVRDVNPGIIVIVHPPTDHKLRAYCRGDEIRPVKPYLTRNADIVTASDHLIATPKSTSETSHGGTWWTIRHTRERGKPVTIVWPDGRIEVEEGG